MWGATFPAEDPRRIEFREHLPRADNGKLYKRGLRDEYAARGRLGAEAAARFS